MAEKVFMERNKCSLLGDDRDIMLPAQYKLAVLSWCRKNQIDIECSLNKDNEDIARRYFGMNLWRIKDEKQRMWFMLRWA
jgi:hypothetical protein